MRIVGTMKIHCDDSGLTCLIAGTANISADQDDIIVYTTDDAGLHWSEQRVFMHNSLSTLCGL